MADSITPPPVTSRSAPGKIILCGEHAVVYGRPALAVPVADVRTTATVSHSSIPGILVLAPDIGLEAQLSHLETDHPLSRVIRSVLSQPGMPACPPITIRVTSTIPIASGLGSGTAVSVAVIRALSTFLGQPLPDEQVSALAFEIEKVHHGTPSGIDNTVITYEKPVYFVKDQPVDILDACPPFSLVIGVSGIPAITRESVAAVRRLWQADRPRLEKVFDQIGEIALQAKVKLVRGKWRRLGQLMNRNHALLQELTVSHPRLDQLVDAARLSGALGAKMSGGGRGGNMIALVEKNNTPAVAGALREAGAVQVIITRVGEPTA